MSHRQHHDKPSRSSNLSPQRARSDQEMAASAVQSPPGSRAFSLPEQQADAPPPRPARQSGGAVPLSSLLHDTRLEDQLRTAEPTGGGGYHPSRPGETPVSSASETEQMSPTRRAYFDPARDADHAYPPPSVRYAQADPQTSRLSRFKLQIVQQPMAARACGHGERDRRVVDPPPILQLTLEDFDPNSAADRAELQHSHNVVHCKLYSATNRSRDVSTITDPIDPSKLIRSLMGMASSTPFVGTDPSSPANLPDEQRIGVYYIFHDISCRHTGRYRLYFELASLSMDVGITRNVVASALSEVFEVYSAKDFPGMRPSSDLTRELKRQGANLPIKKGGAESKGGGRRNKRADRDDSDDSSGDGK